MLVVEAGLRLQSDFQPVARKRPLNMKGVKMRVKALLGQKDDDLFSRLYDLRSVYHHGRVML